MSDDEVKKLSTPEYREHISAELSLVKKMISTARNVLSGLLILAIAGWVVVAVSDHYDLKNTKEKVDWMYPVVQQWYYGHPISKAG